MNRRQPDYLSFLLRLRRVSGGKSAWRASLEDPHSGGLHHFASLEEVFDFLQAQIGLASESAPSRTGAPGGGPDGRAK